MPQKPQWRTVGIAALGILCALAGLAICAKWPAANAAYPNAGFVRVPVLVALLAGAAVALLLAVALHAAGLTSRGWAPLCLAAGAAEAWLVLRAFPEPPR